MNGYATQTDVALWLRLDSPGRVKIEYWKVSNPTSTQAREVRSGGLDNQTVQVILDGLEPGQEYHYRLSSHGQKRVATALCHQRRWVPNPAELAKNRAATRLSGCLWVVCLYQ